MGYAWFKKGFRTRVAYRLGFEYFYLYTAASPGGESFTLLINGVNKEKTSRPLHNVKTIKNSAKIKAF
jgi:hypothetical protein